MALQIVAVDDTSPGECTDVGMVYDGSNTITSSKGIFGTSITLSSGVLLTAGSNIVGSSSSAIIMNTDKFTVDGSDGDTVIGGDAEIGGTLDVYGATKLSSSLSQPTLAVGLTSGSVNIDLTKRFVSYETNGTADIDAALADGAEGQEITIKLVAFNTYLVGIAPVNFFDGGGILLDDVGDYTTLMFAGGTWHVTGGNGTIV